MKPIKQYYPSVNPLPKVQYVRTYVKRDGTVVQAHRAKPKFRHGVTIGFR